MTQNPSFPTLDYMPIAQNAAKNPPSEKLPRKANTTEHKSPMDYDVKTTTTGNNSTIPQATKRQRHHSRNPKGKTQ